jgi:hypothetical protein
MGSRQMYKSSALRMRFIPIGRAFVAEVIGIDLRAPLDADAAAAIHAAMDRYAVLVFHDYPP